LAGAVYLWPLLPFSILERIDVGETWRGRLAAAGAGQPFSILERIDVGETRGGYVIAGGRR